MKKTFLILFTLLSISIIAKAQTDNTETTKVHFKLGLNYNSGLNYYGRTDSLRSSGVFPVAELWLTKDFYINAAPVFVNNKLSSFDYAGTITTIGYQHTSDKLISNIYVLKPFYKQSSQLVQSALKAQSGISFAFLNKALNLTAGADAKLSDKTDIGATGGVDHIFKITNADNSAFVIDPSFYAYAGTQQFTNTYYKKKSSFLLFPVNDQQVTESVNKFNILAYEASVPVVFVKGNMLVSLTPSYIMPQNLITVPNRPDLSERGKDMFYTTIGVKYTF